MDIIKEMNNIDICNINPYLRFIRFVINKSNEHFVPERSLYDYSIVFVEEGVLCFQFDDRMVQLNAGDGQLMPPKIKHKEFIPKDKSCKYFVVHFDMFYSPKRKNYDMNDMYLKNCTIYKKKVQFDPKYVDEDDPNIINAFKEPIFRHFKNINIIEKFQYLFNLSVRQQDENKPLTQLLYKSKLLEILFMFFDVESSVAVNGYFHSIINETIMHCIRHYDEEFDIEVVAKKYGFTPNYFRKIFKDEIGITPHNYLRKIQYENARKLLLESDLSICEISFKVGFKDPLYFTKVFKKIEGISPNAFRKQSKR